MIRIAIVADTLFRAQSLAELLGEDGQLEIVSIGLPSGAFGHDETQVADVIVAIGLSSHELPQHSLPVLALGTQLVQARDLGRSVHAWLPLNSSPQEILAAIHAIAQNLFVLTQDQARKWFRSQEAREEESALEALTPRESQVLRLLADGLGNKEIAGRLGISEHTAKFHVAQILAKLGAASRAEAVALGMRRGLVPV